MSRSTSPPSDAAQLNALAVESLSVLLSCSPSSSVFILENSCFVKFVEQFGHTLDLDARFAVRRLAQLQDPKPWFQIYSIGVGALLRDRLLLCFHDAGKCSETWSVQAQVARDDRRHSQPHRLMSTVDLA